MVEPLVSIVTPIYNAEKYLRDCIRSVQEQSYVNWELILIDDCSTDGSVSIAKEFVEGDRRIVLFETKQNSGAAVSRNIGIDVAKGRYLAFLDSDDMWISSKIQLQVKFMKKNDYAFTFTGYEFADKNCNPTGKKVAAPASIDYKQALKNHIIWTSTVMIDLDIVSKDLISMPDVRRGQDAATWWKILRNTGKAYGINNSLSLYRRTNTSLSANKINAMRRTWYLFTHVENLGFLKSMYNFVWYIFNAAKKRV
jgi:teichuronic acid biosynthesis glycosyltransferase TuaG